MIPCSFYLYFCKQGIQSLHFSRERLNLNERAKECQCTLIPTAGIEQSFSYFHWGPGRDWLWKQALMVALSVCSDVTGSLHPHRWERSLCREDSPRPSVPEGPRDPGGYFEYSGSWSGRAEQKIQELKHLKNIAAEIIDDWSGFLKAVYLCVDPVFISLH